MTSCLLVWRLRPHCSKKEGSTAAAKANLAFKAKLADLEEEHAAVLAVVVAVVEGPREVGEGGVVPVVDVEEEVHVLPLAADVVEPHCHEKAVKKGPPSLMAILVRRPYFPAQTSVRGRPSLHVTTVK